MRTMFFEKPVVAATATSEIGVLARPIREKEPEQQRPGRSDSSFVQACVRKHAIFRGCCYPTTATTSVGPLIVRGRARVGGGLPAWRGTFFLLVVACLSLLPPVAAVPLGRDRPLARSYVTSATPPHVVNTKHGRRTDIHWSSASQAERVNWPQYELPRAAAMRR